MTHKRIKLEDIQITDILFYDPDMEEACLRFCQERALDRLPSLSDPEMCYQITESGFSEVGVPFNRRVDSKIFIFNPTLLERFRENQLLFVYENKELTGVVHFSDYNNPAVSAYLFTLLASYEKALRKLLALNGLINQDMLDYFQEVVTTTENDERRRLFSQKLEDYKKYRARNDKAHAFERFSLRDLVEFAKKREVIEVGDNVSELRNMVMHALEFIQLKDANRDDYIYDFESFTIFFEQVTTLLLDYKRVTNKFAWFQAGNSNR
jgi:hypothetical protein